MINLEKMVGKRVIAIESDKVRLHDGTVLKIKGDDGDCCGYGDFDIFNNGFDFEDNVITKVVPESIDDCFEGTSSFIIGIFSNDKSITIDGATGSGSGWDYGQYIELELVIPDGGEAE